MKNWYAVALCGFLFASDAAACGFTSKLAPFEVAAGSEPAQDASGALLAPVAVVTETIRGIGGNHATCEDTGLLTVVIDWPKGKHKLRDLGFQFRVVSGADPYAIFPEGPIKAPVDGRRSEYLFMWREGAPSQQKFLDMQVEVRAVTHDNVLGPPARVLVRSAPGS